MTIIDEIAGLFARRGADLYVGEAVSQTEHALQSAYFAVAADAGPDLVIAALLHDVGHMVVDMPDDLADWERDARHEAVGAAWLARRFPARIAEPVRLHVPAKRYLCATDARYFATLSSASVVTLRLQGGPMTVAEVAQFEVEPYHAAAIALRRCDDRGKIVGLSTPGLGEYRDWLESFAAAPSPPRNAE